MTLEKIYDGLTSGAISASKAVDLLKEESKIVNFYRNKQQFSNEKLTESQLSQLSALVKILQFIYNSPVESPFTDQEYDELQELLINYGIPRLTGSIEVNDLDKSSHKYTNLRGTLSKIYYLGNDEIRTNKSRRFLSEWISTTENKYKKNTGSNIILSTQKVILTPKFDGASAVMEIGNKIKWLTRGDTDVNKASDISHLMFQFNDLYSKYKNCGIKFEVMCSEENLKKINQISEVKYKNSRQVVVSALNQVEMDFKNNYLKPIPLRIIQEDEQVESIPLELAEYPYQICNITDIDTIREFGNKNRYVEINGEHYRTDGVVISLINKDIIMKLGRDNDINNFEVAYKYPNEFAYSKVKDVEFYVSEFGYITPVVVFNPVILKGNTVQRASISNKERFDELDLHYGDTIKVLYDIIPYITIDEYCRGKNK